MTGRVLASVIVLSLLFVPRAEASLIGATYDFTTSVTGDVVIDPLGGPTQFTDPLNPGFCVGVAPPRDCADGGGLSGSFAFADVTPILSTITFTFFGSTLTLDGTFAVDLGNFVTTDGSTIANVTYSLGNLSRGDFTNVDWDGTSALFTGDINDDSFDALGGRTVVFNVEMEPAELAAVPEPTSLLLLGTGLIGAGARRWRQRKAS